LSGTSKMARASSIQRQSSWSRMHLPDSSTRSCTLRPLSRATPTTTRRPLTLGRAAIDDLTFQHLPVERALSQDRVRLLIADDVGLGKTLEAGLITSELALRGRANRILVVTTRAMLTQFQKEFWTRFSIPLSRLDSAAIRRMRNRIPAHYNVFDQFDRSIVSIDTLKRDTQIRDALKHSYWDLIIIDEAHNAAQRKSAAGSNSQRAELAQLLSRRTDSLLLLTATPHDGSQESFASLIKMLDPTRVPDPARLHRSDIEDLGGPPVPLITQKWSPISAGRSQSGSCSRVASRSAFRRRWPIRRSRTCTSISMRNRREGAPSTCSGRRSPRRSSPARPLASRRSRAPDPGDRKRDSPRHPS
jgi:hypothetical protein